MSRSGWVRNGLASSCGQSRVRPCGGRPARLVRGARPRPAVAADSRSVRDPRLRGDAAADAGRAGDSPVSRVARALAVGRRPRRRGARGCDPRLAGPRLQPPRPEPAPGRAEDRGRGLAGGSDGATRRRPVHGRSGRQLRARPRRPADRRERQSHPGPHGRDVLAGSGPGADGSRREGMPRPDPALRRVPARRDVSLARASL